MSEIEKAFQLNSETEVILRIGEIIWNKTNQIDEDFSSLNEAERTFIYVDILEGQVNNGGFDQFFFNSSGDYTHEILEAYRNIGADRTVEIIYKAIQFFPESPVPKNNGIRRELMQDLDESISENWDYLDNEFYKYEDNIVELLIDYLKKNYKD